MTGAFIYDNAQRLTQVLNQEATTTLDQHTYTLDNAGNHTQVAEVLAQVGGGSIRRLPATPTATCTGWLPMAPIAMSTTRAGIGWSGAPRTTAMTGRTASPRPDQPRIR